MSGLLLILRLLLAATLLVAGVAKGSDRGGSRAALSGFGVPAAAVGLVAIALPVSEIAIAACLFFAATARWGALAACVLLLGFSAGLIRALAAGRRPDCHCFGQLSQAPAGPSSMARNTLLVGVAAVIAFAPGAPGPNLVPWLGGASAAGRTAFWLSLTLVVLVVAVAWFGRELLRAQGGLMLRLEALESSRSREPGLPVGAPAPDFTLPGYGGGELTLDGLLASGLPVVLVFSDADCGPCIQAIPLIGDAQRDWRDRLTIAVVSRGVSAYSEAAWRQHGVQQIGIADSLDVNLSYAAPGTPAAVLISRSGRIDSALAPGLPGIERLLAAPVGGIEGALGDRYRGDLEDGEIRLGLTQIGGRS